MHRTPKNLSQFHPQQSVSSAEEAPSSSGSKRRSGSSFPLVSSPLADKRRRGEAQKNHLGSFNKARFDEADARIDNRYMQYGITKEINSLTIDDSNGRFAEEFDATYLSDGQYGGLESDFFQAETLCDSESLELEEGGENQSDSAEDSSTDLHTFYMNDSSADEEGEMSLEGGPEANHASPSSGVWESLPGETRMRINHGALQNFIEARPSDSKVTALKLQQAFETAYGKESCPSLPVFKIELKKLRAKQIEENPRLPNHSTPRQRRTKAGHKAIQNFLKLTSPDLTMTAQALRKAYIKTHGEESCPVYSVFDRDLKNLRDQWEKENLGQPKLWREHTKVDHKALRNFIETTSSDLTMTVRALREEYIKIHGEESCPASTVFGRTLENLKAEWVKANPGQPTRWREHLKVDHKALRNFIETTSPDLTMIVRELRGEYIEIHGEESCPASSVFERDLKNLRAGWVRKNPSQPTPWEEHIKVDHEALQNFIKATLSDVKMGVRELREEYIKIHGEESCPSRSVFYTALKSLEAKQVEES